jgi:hypothetical protein
MQLAMRLVCHIKWTLKSSVLNEKSMTGQFFAKLTDIKFYEKGPFRRSRIFYEQIRMMEQGTEGQAQQFE